LTKKYQVLFALYILLLSIANRYVRIAIEVIIRCVTFTALKKEEAQPASKLMNTVKSEKKNIDEQTVKHKRKR